MTANDAIAADDAVAFGTTTAIVSHFSFSSDLKDSATIRLNILPLISISNVKLSAVILIAYTLML